MHTVRQDAEIYRNTTYSKSERLAALDRIAERWPYLAAALRSENGLRVQYWRYDVRVRVGFGRASMRDEIAGSLLRAQQATDRAVAASEAADAAALA